MGTLLCLLMNQAIPKNKKKIKFNVEDVYKVWEQYIKNYRRPSLH